MSTPDPLPVDGDPKIGEYAHPVRLVTTAWLDEWLSDDRLVVVESDEDVLLYETGHIPGSVKVDWHLDLNDPVTRDYVNPTAFADLMSRKGISRDTTVVIYGDKSNWWAAYALWVFTLFGHPDVRLLDGGRAKWVAEGREMTTETAPYARTEYPVVAREDGAIRAFKDDVLGHLGKPLVDVRSPGEYSGELLHMPDYPGGGRSRGSHPRRPERPLGAGRRRRRYVPQPARARGDLRGGSRPVGGGRGGCVLPDWGAVVAYLVRAHPPARIPERAQLRRILDRVGQRGPGTHRAGSRSVTAGSLPSALSDLVDDFAAVGPQDRLQLLLDLSRELPPVPEPYASDRDRMEPVPECQSPIFLAVAVSDDRRVHLYFDAPPEAPTTRGFAGILHEGLDGQSVDEVLAVPDDFYLRLGLAEAVSVLRLRGMAAMLARLKRQVRDQSGDGGRGATGR